MPDENVIEHAVVKIHPEFENWNRALIEARRKLAAQKFTIDVEVVSKGISGQELAVTHRLMALRKKADAEAQAAGQRQARAMRMNEERTNALVTANKKLATSTRDLDNRIENATRKWQQHHKMLDVVRSKLLHTDAVYREALRRRGTFGNDIINARKNELVIWESVNRELSTFDKKQEKVHRDSKRLEKSYKGLFDRMGDAKGFRSSASGMGDFIDTGGRGVRPMNALMGAVVAISPALLALASSAAYASTSLVALAPAAMGAVTAFAALGVAFKGVIGAWGLLDQAQKGSEAALAELEARLGRMAPAARTFFGQLLALKNGFVGFAQEVEGATLPGFSSALVSITDKGKQGISTLDLFKQSVIDMGKAISDSTAQAGAFIGSSIFKGALATTIKNNQVAFEALNRAVVALLQPLTRIFAGASPLVVRFMTYIEKLANTFADFIAGFSDTDIEGFFAGAGDELAKWWTIATNLGEILLNILKAALPSGQTLVDRLVALTETIKDWTSAEGNVQKLKGFFDWFARLDFGKIAKGLGMVAAGVGGLKFAMAAGTLFTPGGLIGLGVSAALFTIGAAAFMAYTKIEAFRDLVNETGAVLLRMWQVISEKVKPALDKAFENIGKTIEENKPAFDSMLHFFEGLAPVIGETLVVAIGYVSSELSRMIEILTFSYKAWLSFSVSVAKVLQVVVESIGFLDGIVLGFLKNISSNAAKILRASGNELLARGFEAVGGYLESGASSIDDSVKTASDFLQRSIDNGEKLIKEAEAAAVPKAPALISGPEAGRYLPEQRKVRPGAGKPAAGQLVFDPAAIKGAKDQMDQARQAVTRAGDAVVDAQNNIKRGQRELVTAQRELNEARAEAAKHLRELRAEVQGLAADEEDARLKFLYAQEKLKSFEYTNAVDPLVRRAMRNEAAQAEADLNKTLADGKEKRQELTDAEKRGIENSPEVLRAKERLVQVTEDQAKNYRELRRAQDDARTAANGLTTAQNGLSVAQRGVTAAVDGTTGAVGNLAAKLKALPAKKELNLIVHPRVFAEENKIGQKQHSVEGYISIIDLQAMNKKQVRATGKTAVGGPKRTISSGGGTGGPKESTSSGRYAWPLPGHHNVSSGYGVNRGRYSHGGIDYPAPSGTPIVSIGAGRVIQAGWYGGGGNTVSIAYPGNLVARYMHMSRILASLNSLVAPGQQIGLVGSTGDSSGPHLHFQTEVGGQKVNPAGVIGGAADTGAIPGAVTPGGVTAVPVLSDAASRLVATVSANQYARQVSTQLANTMGAKLPVPELSRTFVLPTGVFDNGGTLAPGPNLVLNRTGRAERLSNTTDGHTIRLDKRDIQLLASMLAVASAQRPIEMDGTEVTKKLNSQQYVPLGV